MAEEIKVTDYLVRYKRIVLVVGLLAVLLLGYLGGMQHGQAKMCKATGGVATKEGVCATPNLKHSCNCSDRPESKVYGFDLTVVT